MSKTSISSSILESKARKGIGIIPFLTSGYPSLDESEEIVKSLIEEKLASAIEIGIHSVIQLLRGKQFRSPAQLL